MSHPVFFFRPFIFYTGNHVWLLVFLRYGSFQLAPTYYYNVPTSIGNVDTRLLLLDITGGHVQHHDMHVYY